MKAIITDRKTKQTTTFCNVTQAVTRLNYYIAIHYIDEDGRKESDVFDFREAEVKLLAE